LACQRRFKGKVVHKKNYLVEFSRYEIGDMFGLSELVNKNNRGSQISALKDSFLYAFPIDALNEILSEHERKQIVSYQKLESEKLRLLNKNEKSPEHS
jgi:Predicted signal-transduction protein containing cAMP-binding and CBS domains